MAPPSFPHDMICPHLPDDSQPNRKRNSDPHLQLQQAPSLSISLLLVLLPRLLALCPVLAVGPKYHLISAILRMPDGCIVRLLQ
jgi:hypothetical protein